MLTRVKLADRFGRVRLDSLASDGGMYVMEGMVAAASEVMYGYCSLAIPDDGRGGVVYGMGGEHNVCHSLRGAAAVDQICVGHDTIV